MTTTEAQAALREHLWATRGDRPEWATAYHQTIADLRRELIEAHLDYQEHMAPHRAVVFAAMDARRAGEEREIPAAEMNAYTGLMMSAGYSYALAAVLERAEKLDPEVARKLAALADGILQNGGEEEICADVWPSAAGICKNCRKPIEPCTVRREHAGCSSGHGYIHRKGGHTCEQRSDGPYAQPIEAGPREEPGDA
jgi:hypothetical protein